MVVDVDLEKFFDRIDHDILIDRLRSGLRIGRLRQLRVQCLALSSCLTPKTIANASIVSELSPCRAVTIIGSKIDFRNLVRSTEA